MCAVSFSSEAANVVTLDQTGVRKFGPDMTDNEACRQAMAKAKQNALLEIYGEQRTELSVLACNNDIQRSTGNDCEIHETTWSLIGTEGFIKDVTTRDQQVRDVIGARECEVKIRVTIQDYAGRSDPSFESKVSFHHQPTASQRLGKQPTVDEPTVNFKPGETARIQINSSQKAFHYVFFWAPRVDKETYHLLFPNDWDRQSQPVRHLEIPSPEASTQWEIEIQLSEDIQYSHEYLMVVSTKDAIEQPPLAISEQGFYRWLSNKPRNEWTLAKYSYRIIGDIL